jgi:hypothetical protein
MQDCLEDLRSPNHTKHSLVQMVRQRVYQIAAGYEDCNDADYRGYQSGGESFLPRPEMACACLLRHPSGAPLQAVLAWGP